MTPIATAERLPAVDVLRGFALFGILLVNMPAFAWPVRVIITQVAEWKGLYDNLAYSFIVLFGESKFFSMFSLLFGFGLYMMMERTGARGGRFVPLYLRRLLVLLLIGLVHILGFWVGDILVLYAILGGLLLLFHKAQSKTLLTWGVTILFLIAVFYVGLLGFIALKNMQPDGAVRMAQFFAETKAAYKQAAAQTIQAYRHGTLAEILTQHQVNFKFMWAFTPFLMPNIFAMFLLGLYIGQRGILQDIPAYLPLIRRVQLVGLGLGFTGELLVILLSEITNLIVPTPLGTLRSVIHVFSGPILALGYMSTLVLLLQKDTWLHRLAPLASMGRMSLTIYLMQTLICTTIFYHYGLGLYGQVGPAAGLILTVVIFALQIPFSLWWLTRFRFGPTEWLWRSLTYLQWQPMRLKVP